MTANSEQKAALSQNRHLESWLYPVNVAVARVVPLSLAYHISLPIADIFYWLWKSKREGAFRNYARMLGCSPDDEKVKRLARSSFRNFGKYVAELLHVQGWPKGQFQRVTIQGDENFDEARRHGKGVIFTSAHMGSIEVGSALVLMKGFRITSVMEQLRPKVMMDWIVTCRAKMGVSLLPTAGTGLHLLRALRRGEMVALIVDVGYRDDGGGVPVNFLGHPTYFPAGPARLARISGAPIVFGVAVRRPGNRFIAYGSPPIFSDRKKDAEQDIRDVTQQLVDIFERFVRRYPDQWYVFRDMWPGEE
ncbi:MAG: lysophospholipid acyltransferase family protein [Dehalococcoidia bacterium]|nr:MAG: lysophospholipid acyltransferase family protein [Dehalococcoidia bacterium]